MCVQKRSGKILSPVAFLIGFFFPNESIQYPISIFPAYLVQGPSEFLFILFECVILIPFITTKLFNFTLYTFSHMSNQSVIITPI